MESNISCLAKHIYLIRHAKSSWNQLGLRDHDRPLNKRGLRDAPQMAKKINALKFQMDHLISSSAKRALQTATYFSNEFKLETTIEKSIYHGEPSDYLELIECLDDDLSHVAFFGHNPGLTYLVNDFSVDSIDNVPKCGFCHLKCNISSWSEVSTANTTLKKFLYPKMFSWAQ